jgi:xylose isomerase
VSLFFHPVFRDGAFTANDPEVRAYALQKTLHAMDLGVELGAKSFVLWEAAKASRPMPAAAPTRP